MGLYREGISSEPPLCIAFFIKFFLLIIPMWVSVPCMDTVWNKTISIFSYRNLSNMLYVLKPTQQITSDQRRQGNISRIEKALHALETINRYSHSFHDIVPWSWFPHFIELVPLYLSCTCFQIERVILRYFIIESQHLN